MENSIKETRQVLMQKFLEECEAVERVGAVYFVYGQYGGRAYSDYIHQLHNLYGFIPNVFISTPQGKYYFYGQETYCDKLKNCWGGSKNNECLGLYSVSFPFNNKEKQISFADVIEVLL